MERWVDGVKLGTGVFTVPTAMRIRDVDFWVVEEESEVWDRIDAGFDQAGFAGWVGCPRFAQGGVG